MLLLILLLIMAAAILVVNFFENEKQNDIRNDLIFANTLQSLKLIEKEVNRVPDSLKQKTEAGIDLTLSILKTLSKGTYYSGSRIFNDGVIVQIVNERILYPPSFPWHFEILNDEEGTIKPLDVETLREGLSLELVQMVNHDTGDVGYMAITTGKITDDLWYIDMTSGDEYAEMVKSQEEIFSIINDLQGALNGLIILFETNAPDLNLYYAPSEFALSSNAETVELLKNAIESQKSLLSIEDQNYSAYYSTLRLFKTPLIAVILINSTNEMVNMINNIGMILLLMLIAVIIVIFWIYWVQKYVRDHELTENQKQEYHPRHIRRVTRSVGLIGVFVFFFIAAALDSLGNLSLQSAKNNKTLDLIESKMESNSNMISRFRNDEESWAVYYASRLGQLLIDNPEIQTRELLTEANDRFGYEYMMLFDENGKEVLSSNSLIGLDIESDLISSSNDFQRLLQGVPSIAHEPEKDPIKEEKLIQLFGASVFDANHEVKGAMIIALDPEKSWMAAEKEDYSSFINMITPSGSYAIVADAENDLILYSNEQQFEGELASRIGLYDGDAPETELDSFKIYANQSLVNCYGAYQKDERYHYYYLTVSDVFQRSVLPFGAASAIGFLIVYWIVTSFMLKPYRSDVYNEIIKVSDSTRQDSIFDESINTDFQSDDDSQESLSDIWHRQTPKRKASLFVQISLAFILIMAVITLYGPGSSAALSAINFILQGTWRRGINLLSFAGIMILIISFIIIVLFKNLLLNLISSILDRKVETIFRLAFSFIQYAAIIAFLYFAFDFLGIDTRALLASVSLLSLAVSLGAKDLVADILAGIFIIFEDDFRVGDIIEINGFSGIVQEIGVRSTKLVGIGDNIKIFGNQSVKNVLNMSKMNSWYSLDLNVSADQPLKEIEAMLEEELPNIGELIPEIISGPYYKGVMSIGYMNTLYIIAECKQMHYRRVQRKLNHAILDLFEEKGFKIS